MFPGNLDPAMFQGLFAGMLANPDARGEIEKAIADWFRSKDWHEIAIYNKEGYRGDDPILSWGSPEVIAYELCELATKHLAS